MTQTSDMEAKDSQTEQSLGSLLFKARQKKSLSLESIASKTKININILKAIEEDNFSHTPGYTYLKGFVKSFAREVGVETNLAIKKLNSQIGTTTPKNFIKQTEAGLSEQEGVEDLYIVKKFDLNTLIPSKGIVILIFSLIFLCIIIFYAYKYFSSAIEQAPVNIPSQKESHTMETKSTVMVKKADDELATESDNDSESTELNISEQPTEKNIEKNKELIASTEEPSIPKDKKENVKEEKKDESSDLSDKHPVLFYRQLSPPLYSVLEDAPENKDKEIFPDKFRFQADPALENIYIYAHAGDTWLTYKKDDDQTRSFTLNKGQSLFIKGSVILLFFGNVNTAKVFYNNKLLNIPSRTGVKSLVFPESKIKDYNLPLFVTDKKSGQLYTVEEYIKMYPEAIELLPEKYRKNP